MLALLWVILVLCFYLFFLYLCIKAIGYVNKEMGLGTSIFFTIGLLATCGGRVQQEKSSKNPDVQHTIVQDTSLHFHENVSVLLDKNWMFGIGLLCTYAYNRNNEPVILSYKTYQSGTVIGVDWIPQRIVIGVDTLRQELQYDVSGNLKWQLFNSTIITNGKNYSGSISIRSAIKQPIPVKN